MLKWGSEFLTLWLVDIPSMASLNFYLTLEKNPWVWGIPLPHLRAVAITEFTLRSAYIAQSLIATVGCTEKKEPIFLDRILFTHLKAAFLEEVLD